MGRPLQNVRFGSLADIGARITDVRFTPQKGIVRVNWLEPSRGHP
jgi:hypothetical protein